MMVDDLRNHDAAPSSEERAWMEHDIAHTLVRGLVLAAVALGIGVGASLVLEPALHGAALASAQR